MLESEKWDAKFGAVIQRATDLHYLGRVNFREVNLGAIISIDSSLDAYLLDRDLRFLKVLHG